MRLLQASIATEAALSEIEAELDEGGEEREPGEVPIDPLGGRAQLLGGSRRTPIVWQPSRSSKQEAARRQPTPSPLHGIPPLFECMHTCTCQNMGKTLSTQLSVSCCNMEHGCGPAMPYERTMSGTSACMKSCHQVNCTHQHLHARSCYGRVWAGDSSGSWLVDIAVQCAMLIMPFYAASCRRPSASLPNTTPQELIISAMHVAFLCPPLTCSRKGRGCHA